MIDRAYVQRMARYNRWQNENLYGVADSLSDDERRLERGAWFGSIHKTLSHILWGDRDWMGRFTDLPRPMRAYAVLTRTNGPARTEQPTLRRAERWLDCWEANTSSKQA